MAQSERLFDQGQRIHQALKSDPQFIHAGEDSRGISISGIHVREQLNNFAISLLQHDERSAEVVMLLSRLFEFSMAEGGYVRTNDVGETILLDLRGDPGDLDVDGAFSDLTESLVRISGIEITLNENGNIHLHAHSTYLAIRDEQEAGAFINQRIQSLNPRQIHIIGTRLLGIIKEEVQASGEFVQI